MHTYTKGIFSGGLEALGLMEPTGRPVELHGSEVSNIAQRAFLWVWRAFKSLAMLWLEVGTQLANHWDTVGRVGPNGYAPPATQLDGEYK